jgi:hypothetical protein
VIVPLTTVRIADIKVGVRHRRDNGDLTALQESIRDVGLLQPVGVNSRLELVYGGRRLAACRLLGWVDVPTVQLDSLDDAVTALKAERDENICRKEMTASELYALGKDLEALERPKAQERITGAGRTAGTPSGNFPQGGTGRTADKVGEALGMSGRQYQKMKAVVDNGVPELVKQVDAGEVTVNAAETVSTLPEEEQVEVVKKGGEAVKQKAVEMRAGRASAPAHHQSGAPRPERPSAVEMFTPRRGIPVANLPAGRPRCTAGRSVRARPLRRAPRNANAPRGNDLSRGVLACC